MADRVPGLHLERTQQHAAGSGSATASNAVSSPPTATAAGDGLRAAPAACNVCYRCTEVPDTDTCTLTPCFRRRPDTLPPSFPPPATQQACCPHLLSLDDLLAIRCVCQAWRQSLSSAFCTTWRLPQSLWHTAADNIQFDATIRAAAASCKHTPCLLLDSGPGRPSIPITVWAGLLPQLRPWMVAGGKGVSKHLRVHLRNPASPTQLVQLRHLPWLHSLRLQHSHASIYSRHLLAIAALTQLQELSLLMEMPKLELRSLAHQRLRRVPLKADCLSCLVRLERLEVSCKAYTGEGIVVCVVCCVVGAGAVGYVAGPVRPVQAAAM